MTAIDEIAETLRATTIACHPLLCQLHDIGNCREFNGGRTIVTELEHPMQVQAKPTPSIAWYSGYEVLKFDEPRPISNLHEQFRSNEEIFTASEWPIRQIGMLGGADLASRAKDLGNMLAHAISMGGPSGAVNSLPFLVSTSPTIGVIGGIDRSRWKFWRNLSVKYNHRPIERDLLRLVMSHLAIRESGKTVLPDLILMGEHDFNALCDSIPEDERITTKYSSWGFKSLDLDGSCVVMDPNIGPCVDNYSYMHPRIYFLHTRFFWWRWHTNRNWAKIDQGRYIEDGVPPLPPLYAWAGNLTLTCSYAQGVLHRFS